MSTECAGEGFLQTNRQGAYVEGISNDGGANSGNEDGKKMHIRPVWTDLVRRHHDLQAPRLGGQGSPQLASF